MPEAGSLGQHKASETSFKLNLRREQMFVPGTRIVNISTCAQLDNAMLVLGSMLTQKYSDIAPLEVYYAGESSCLSQDFKLTTRGMGFYGRLQDFSVTFIPSTTSPKWLFNYPDYDWAKEGADFIVTGCLNSTGRGVIGSASRLCRMIAHVQLGEVPVISLSSKPVDADKTKTEIDQLIADSRAIAQMVDSLRPLRIVSGGLMSLGKRE